MPEMPNRETLNGLSLAQLRELRVLVDQLYKEAFEVEKAIMIRDFEKKAADLGLPLGDLIIDYIKPDPYRKTSEDGAKVISEFYLHPTNDALRAGLKGRLPKWALDAGLSRDHLRRVRQETPGGPFIEISPPSKPFPK